MEFFYFYYCVFEFLISFLLNLFGFYINSKIKGDDCVLLIDVCVDFLCIFYYSVDCIEF